MDVFTSSVWRQLVDQWTALHRVVGFFAPPIDLPGWMAPGLAIGALLALAVAAGVALASLGVLLTALLVAHLLLDRVFGVTVALTPPRLERRSALSGQIQPRQLSADR
jgi:hypothetical protein